jgi:long-chain acyl-CoA synthetase
VRIGDFLGRSARLHARRAAVEDAAGALTYAALAECARRLAAGLVALLAQNRADTVALYFACADLGAVLVPLNWRLRPAEIAFIAADCAPRVLIAEEAFLPALEPARGAAAAAFVHGPARGAWRAFEELAASCDAPRRAVGEDDVAVMMYTSGTTGRPKGAMLTHKNVAGMTQAWLLDMRLDPGDRFLQVTPLFHVGGMMMLMSCAAAGATLVLHPEFDPVEALRALAEDGVTHTLLVPAMIQWILMEPALAGRSFPALRLIVYGASPMPPALLERALAVFGCDFLQGYGLTETAGVVLTLRPEDHRWPAGEPPPRRLASAGRDLLCSEVRVVDAEGRPLAPGAVGEIVARGDNVTPGYWNRPEETAEALRDGWLHTGDLATVDDEGYVYVVDRLKDMILVGGENVYPREVEERLALHPAVREAAVIGIPHEVWGEEVLALVVPGEAGTPPDARELIRHCRAGLARFKCPTKVELRAELPRNAAGKLEKRALREPYWRHRERNV